MKNIQRLKRKKRIRSKVFGTVKCPRLSVFRSLTDIYVQAIDDNSGKTLASASLKDLKSKENTIEGARQVGKKVAENCAKVKITKAVFDRGGYKYHGKIKSLAEGAREGGLKF